MAERILCPIDFTLFSDHAIQYAVALARAQGSTVTALHVVPELPPAGGRQSGCIPPDATAEDVGALEAHALRTLQEAGARSRSALVVRGHPAAEILRVAHSLPADLIVMASHGRTGFATMTCGSTTTDVLRQARCAVLTVPRTSPRPQEHIPFSRILCAVDFSPASLRALHRAVSFAAAPDSQLMALHVIGPRAASVVTPVRAAPPRENGQDNQRVLAPTAMWQRRLREAVGEEGRLKIEVTEHVRQGDAADEILRMARAEECDLISLGAHLGNPLKCTLNKVVRGSVCPVLTVRT
jgi:nucleotide-binding universal stress UspA family protein